jgi:FKBP12-rapamycin complex-associated protein
MAVLEAFVYDPLINWRILTKPSEPVVSRHGMARDPTNYAGALGTDAVTSGVFPENFSTTRRARLGEEINRLEEESINRPEAVNAGALNVVTHVSNKLTGREYGTADALDIQAQVNRLILDAIKVENLCQAYVGWCPFW